jgi:hypothetical protein
VRVLVDHPRRYINDEQDEISTREGLIRLIGHFVLEDAAGFKPTAGIDDIKRQTSPLDFDSFAVARNAPVFFDDGFSASRESIHE